MHNVEFKAELRDMTIALAVCRAIKATHIAALEQTDTYYQVTNGRLKKRETVGEPVEYVYYERANRSHPKLSHFTLYDEEQALARFGTQPLPVWLVVRKQRDLWMHGSVRIHLDKVEGLGTFIEFEALVSKDNHVARCHESIAELRRAFGPAMGEPIDCGYSDLLARESETA
ncbi:MAG: class IV adenylate cyclase [Phycisphaerales bacterium]|nr:class IV adenylate cyclase [Phycisphaerales bacterium]